MMSTVLPIARSGGACNVVVDLEPEQIFELAAYGHAHRYAKGDPIFSEGDDPDSLWIVRQGRVHLTKSSARGNETLVAFYTDGQAFCVAATLIAEPYPCRATAAIDSVVLTVPGERFQQLFERMPSFAKRLLLELAPEVCAAHCACAMGVEKAETRLAHAALRLDRRFGGGTIPFTRAEIAQMANTTVETCIRTLRVWQKKGWIQAGRGKIRLLRREPLQSLVG